MSRFTRVTRAKDLAISVPDLEMPLISCRSEIISTTIGHYLFVQLSVEVLFGPLNMTIHIGKSMVCNILTILGGWL